MPDYASPEERQQAIKEKFRNKGGAPFGHPYYPPKTPEAKERQRLADHHKFEKGHDFFPPKTPETAERKLAGNLSGAAKGSFANNPAARARALENSHAAMRGMPKVTRGDNPSMESSYKSFAKMIRGITNNGWELVEAVHEIFQQSREAGKHDMTLNAATWLADRGFGKPVQVTALTDAEGNPVAFQLWQPMTHDAEDDSQPPVIIDHLARPEFDTSAPPTPVEKQPDIYALGPARIWGQDQDKEQIDE